MATAITTEAEQRVEYCRQVGYTVYEQFRLKSGSNKGHRRIWIEGARLLRTGLVRGTKLSRRTDQWGTYLMVDPDKSLNHMSGRHTVAGTDTRPIIDLCGKWVTEFVGSATHVDIIIHDRAGEKSISIYPVTEGGAK